MSAVRTHDSVAAAHDAGLVYVTDTSPGIARVPAGKGFKYVSSAGRIVRDEGVLRRIRALVIPPAWRSVWICPSANGHLQATGRDVRGRKQYRYHARYRSERETRKYGDLTAFGEALPAIRKQVQRDLSLGGLTRPRVLATVVNLLDLTSMRVGNEEYARENHSFGLTTLRNQHASVEGTTLRLRFRGKSGKIHSLELHDRRVAKIVKRCHDLPGHELFQYVDDSGEIRAVDSAMVNEYLREVGGRDITAKDFRTWHGTVKAAIHLMECAAGSTDRELTLNVATAVKAVAGHLGNLPATCRKYYIHPAVLDAYSQGALGDAMSMKIRSSSRLFTAEERCVLKLLKTAQRASRKESRRARAA